MKTKELFIIDEGGIQKLTLQLKPIGIDNAVLNKLSEGVSLKIQDLLPSPMVGGRKETCISMVLSKSLVSFTVSLDSIMLRCPFSINDQKELFAAFDSSSSPKMALSWKVPVDMWLTLVILCGTKSPTVTNQYLVARCLGDDARIFYRLPLPNVYENGLLCAGKFNLTADSYVEIVKRCVDQFYSSEWNTDLQGRGDHDYEAPPKLFRFLPQGETVIEQKNDYGDWRRFCTTISDATLEKCYGN